ncbi:hypothetical protein [Microvirga sp. M2]|uniref:hypothetical protein n=1 Tax=Microvirga sp. M2 TaxID=3073270 RepID=UPI0039C462BC
MPQTPRIEKPAKPALSPHHKSSSTGTVLPTVVRELARPKERRVWVAGGLVKLTGFHEGVPRKADENSPFSLQINQAGHWLVGWFSATDDAIPNVSEVVSLPSRKGDTRGFETACRARGLEASTRIGVGMFIGWIEEHRLRLDGRDRCFVPIEWSRKPVCRGEFNDLDQPFWPAGSAGEARPQALESGQGYLVLEREKPYPKVLGQATPTPAPDRREWTTAGIIFSDTPSQVFERLERVSTVARIPWAVIGQQAEPLRGALIAHHVAPLPSRWIRKLLQNIVPITEFNVFDTPSSQRPAVDSTIEQWQTGIGTQIKAVARERVLRSLIDVHSTILRLNLPMHRSQIRDLIVAQAQLGTKVTLTAAGRLERSYYEIYCDMIAEELLEAPGSAPDFLRPVAKVGTFPVIVDPSRNVRYVVSFEESKVPLPGFLPQADLLKVTLPIPGEPTVALFDMKVARQIVELETKDGSPGVDTISGLPKVKRLIEEIDLTGKASATALHTVGVVSFGIRGSGKPPTVALQIASTDLTYADFGGGYLHFVNATVLPKVSLGNVAAIAPAGSGFLWMTLPRRNDMEVWGSVTELPTLGSGVVEKGKAALGAGLKATDSLEDARKAWDALSGFKKESMPLADGLGRLQANIKELISLRIGYGRVWTGSAGRANPTPDPLRPKPLVYGDDDVQSLRGTSAWFERDDFSLSTIVQARGQTVDKGWMMKGRDNIEIFAALGLAVLLHPRARISVKGYASPEGPAGPQPRGEHDPYNRDLSEDRAQAVAQALADALALYPEGSWPGLDGLDIQALGELPAREQGGLLDPPSTLNEPVFIAWCRSHPDEVTKWPMWRKVEVEVMGLGLLRVVD